MTKRTLLAKQAVLITLLLLTSIIGYSQIAVDSLKPAPPPEKKWYETINLRGYAQFRYNRLLETNPDLKCEQCDKSWGDKGGMFIRRARIVLSGQIGKRVYFYLQPDFATSATPTNLHYVQIRDAYIDLGLDKENEFRIRIGQSKVPYGFDNLQSSQIRLAIDRDDALNSGVANERDLGAFVYWASKEKRKLFADLVKDGLKGSGDYGIVGFGIYNGQTANKPELNDEFHFAARVTYPFVVGNQIIEPSLQGYSGKYVMATDQLSPSVKVSADKNYDDRRAAASFVLYPKPFGIQAEYTFGKGPEFNTLTDSIEVQKLQGGYVTLSYLVKAKSFVMIPYARIQYYDGGKKQERDARSYTVKEFELGIEWQPFKQFEFVAAYVISSRRFEDYSVQSNLQKGNLLRLQAQLNF